MARTPKGSIARNPADWNMRRMYFNQFPGGTVAADTDESIILGNTSQDGKSLVVWDVTVTVAGSVAGVVDTPTVQGQLGQFAVDFGLPTDGLSAPAIPGSPVGAGRMQLIDPGRVIKFGAYDFVFGQGTWQWPHDWPFCVIPPGWNYFWSLFGSTDAWGVGVYYEEVINPYN